jgi:AbrB family looped-hinge helix DNA binding protein
MTRVTTGRRVTIPKALAERYGIRPGETVEWVPDGDGIRLEFVRRRKPLKAEARLKTL